MRYIYVTCRISKLPSYKIWKYKKSIMFFTHAFGSSIVKKKWRQNFVLIYSLLQNSPFCFYYILGRIILFSSFLVFTNETLIRPWDLISGITQLRFANTQMIFRLRKPGSRTNKRVTNRELRRKSERIALSSFCELLYCNYHYRWLLVDSVTLFHPSSRTHTKESRKQL